MAESQKIHPATLVTNIKTHVPIVLDYDGSQYNNWSTLFKLHCRAYLVIDHITPVAKESESDKEKPATNSSDDTALWQRLDDIVRQWIYGTISNDLLNSIIDPDDKAIDTWNRLENFFHNNKSARALNLDAQFTNTKLEQFDGVKPYCTHLKTLADSLRNVGDKVSDNRMALQLLKGLSEEYKPFRTSVRHLSPLPSFDTLRSMLELEEQSNSSDLASEVRDEALVTASNIVSQSPSANSSSSKGENSRGKHKGKGKGSGGKGKGGAAGTTTSSSNIRRSSNRAKVAPPPNSSSSRARGGCFPRGHIGATALGQPHPVRTQPKARAQIRGQEQGRPNLPLKEFSGLDLIKRISQALHHLIRVMFLPTLSKLCTQCLLPIRITIWIPGLPLT
ncbi:Retrovirus-related Pol polyprotein from transposon TNT 1-94 [Bienertia sinuspersici]